MNLQRVVSQSVITHIKLSEGKRGKEIKSAYFFICHNQSIIDVTIYYMFLHTKMKNNSSLLFFFFALFTLSVKGFTICYSTKTVASLGSFTSTCLRASESSEENEAEEEEPEPEEKVEAPTDILNSPAFLKRKLEVLKKDITQADEDLVTAKQRLEEGKAEWGSQIDTLRAEYENIQNRLNSNSNKKDSISIVQVVREMLDVLDNYDRAFTSITAETDEEKAIQQEYRDTYTALLDTFSELGVEEIKTLGEEFDYEVHQALFQKPSEDYEEGLVCEEFAKGFKMEDTLIRPAMVAVAV